MSSIQTLTFLMTDIEGSTRLAQEAGDLWPSILDEHRTILREVWRTFDGQELGTEGDSFLVSFERTLHALQAAVEAQRAIARHSWPVDKLVRIRAGIHTGEVTVKEDGYSGLALHEVARLSSAAHGGQILMSEAARHLISHSIPRGILIRDIGEYRFKDLDEPRRVFQIDAAGLETSFPRLRTTEMRRHNLPLTPMAFIGKAEEMLEVQGLITSHRLLTLTGTGGAGKTRLAIELAHRLLDQFPDGVWLVDLSPIEDPGLVAQMTLSTLQIKEDPGRRPIDALASTLRPAKSLLVFDNCERVIAGCAEIAEHLLQNCPGVNLLMTSRQPIQVAGEATWRVRPLGVPPSDGVTTDQLMAHESVQLFLARASLVHPGFSLVDANAKSIVRICHRLEGLPLAIELAASKVDVLPIDAIAERLEDSFRLLGETRSTTLRAVINSSYGLLSEAEKGLFARLSVFGGGWTLEAVEKVCSGADLETDLVLDLLSGLVRKSLVTLDIESSGRYRMLETIRAYAAEKLLESNFRDRAIEAHLQWLIDLAGGYESKYNAGKLTEWLDSMDDERDNIRSAISMCLAEEALIPSGLLLGVKAYSWVKIRGPRAEGQRWLEELASKSPPDAEGRWKALSLAADLASDRGELEHARHIFSSALELAAKESSELPRADVLMSLVHFETTWGDFEEAAKAAREALAIYEELDHPRAEGARSRLARIATAAGDVSARPILERTLSEAKDPHERGLAERLLALSFLLTDDLNEAQSLFTKAHDDARAAKCVDCAATALNFLAAAAARSGDHAEAARLYAQALREHSSIEHVGGLLDSIQGLGASQANSDPERAAILVGAADGIRNRLGVSHKELWQRSEVEWAESELTRSDPAWIQSLKKRGARMSMSEIVDFALREGDVKINSPESG